MDDGTHEPQPTEAELAAGEHKGDVDDTARPDAAALAQPTEGPLAGDADLRQIFDAWAQRVEANPPRVESDDGEADTFVPLRMAVHDIAQAFGQAEADVDALAMIEELQLEAWGFHMHMRPQALDPATLRSATVDEGAWLRLRGYPEGALQNKLLVMVTQGSVARACGRAQTGGEPPPPPSSAAPPAASTRAQDEPHQTAPRYDSAGTLAPRADEVLRCKLCDSSPEGSWILLDCRGRLVPVCIACGRAVTAVLAGPRRQ